MTNSIHNSQFAIRNSQLPTLIVHGGAWDIPNDQAETHSGHASDERDSNVGLAHNMPRMAFAWVTQDMTITSGTERH